MKYFLQSPDATGAIDGALQTLLLDFLTGRVTSEAEADCVVMPIAYAPNYRFHPALNSLTKPVVVLDFLEFGWDAGDKENRLGHGIDRPWFSHLESDEWTKLDKWASDHPPVLTLKRELFERDRGERLLPIEWPCALPPPPLQSKEEFDARPIEVFFNWGYSNPLRPLLHGSIFKSMRRGINVLDSLDDYRGQSFTAERTWMTIHTPYYRRRPIEEVMEWQRRAKISVSLPGAGVVCFRHSEAPVGSIMALPRDFLAWVYPWIHGENCLRLDSDWLWSDLEAATHRTDLYDIYVASQENIDRYRSQRYVDEYVLPAIETVL